MKDHKLDFTGERFHPECEREIWYEHYHRYVFALDFVAGRRVLDLACGEGYGSSLLARRAATVIGVDRCPEAIVHASERYRAPNLSFLVADATNVALADRSVDVVVSFETLEHLEAQEEMLTELDRVLGDDGLLLISSPDRRTYSDERDYHNEYHVRELYKEQFEALLEPRFKAVRLLGQKLAFQSVIWDPDTPSGRYRRGELDQDQDRIGDWSMEPLYWIALCAREPQGLKNLPADLWLFGDREQSVYEHYYHEIRKNMRAGEILAERERRIEDLERRLEAAAGNRSSGWFERLKNKIR